MGAGCGTAPWTATPAARAGSTHGLAWAVGARRRPGLVDGRRRPARARLPGHAAAARRRRSTSGDRPCSPSRTPPDSASRSGCPGHARVVHQMADVRGGRSGRVARRHRHPVQRGAGHPRAGRADRTGAGGLLHLGRRRGVPLAGPERAGARVATVVDARFLHPATDDLGTPMAFGRTTYNHSPSDLKHYCMARNNVVNLRDYRGPAHVAAFVGQDAVVLQPSPDPSRARLRLSVQAMRDGLARPVQRSREVPRVTRSGPSRSPWSW